MVVLPLPNKSATDSVGSFILLENLFERDEERRDGCDTAAAAASSAGLGGRDEAAAD